MKNILIKFVIIQIIFISLISCGSNRVLMDINRGMTKEDVVNILGIPVYRSFNMTEEEWSYEIAQSLSEYINIRILFRNDKVIQMTSGSMKKISKTIDTHSDDDKIEKLYNRIKEKHFDKERLEVLEFNIGRTYLNCKQAVHILSLFSFEENKINALKLIASKITDIENYEIILDVFFFNEEEAKSILKSQK